MAISTELELVRLLHDGYSLQAMGDFVEDYACAREGKPLQYVDPDLVHRLVQQGKLNPSNVPGTLMMRYTWNAILEPAPDSA